MGRLHLPSAGTAKPSHRQLTRAACHRKPWVVGRSRAAASVLPPGESHPHCHNAPQDAIPGLQPDAKFSQPTTSTDCKGILPVVKGVPLYLERDDNLSAALGVPWCDDKAAHAGNGSSRCCLGLVRPTAGIHAFRPTFVLRLKQLLRGEIPGIGVKLPSYTDFASKLQRVIA